MEHYRPVSVSVSKGSSVIVYTIAEEFLGHGHKYNFQIVNVDEKQQKMVFEICLDGVVKAKNESSPFPTKAFKKKREGKEGEYYKVTLKCKKAQEIVDYFPQPQKTF
ncbi:uncharacterized protein LOC131949576 [Physella acuta]|uniref:uncharacterized protein LOC131949576 n=1 Tax=Physella acuta TaxID=109671 RepID=UPI0027DB7177|nr:uncharacterized protein LOC131949576 [Physella acuta]XP_059167405.1 uncharacterized protein LOC131949576 [Physella acuta]